jgi:hypothetical protein
MNDLWVSNLIFSIQDICLLPSPDPRPPSDRRQTRSYHFNCHSLRSPA